MREHIMNGFKTKVENRKKDNKGFTLVELIVVIVILAILAAILVPGLMKWIDKAKEEQYVLEARNVYLAVEAEIANGYAKNSRPASTDFSEGSELLKKVMALADVTEVKISTLTYKETDATKAGYWDIEKLTIEFKSTRDEKIITATLDGNNTWTIDKIESGTETE